MGGKGPDSGGLGSTHFGPLSGSLGLGKDWVVLGFLVEGYPLLLVVRYISSEKKAFPRALRDQASQSMQVSGLINKRSGASWKASTGHTSTNWCKHNQRMLLLL
ncbi:MAG: hypothetical protein CM1200mP29_08430 [Verrucomicrobiota bacterium]|nr:MAG: hypothetical protein CM1200mP29_08430 [Verrucomicrobiota bacterium]